MTSNSVNLLWKQGRNGCCKQTFIIRWHSDDGEEYSKEISESDKTEMEYLLEGLTEAKNYTIYLFSQNRFRKSDETHPVHIRTLGKIVFF